MRDRKLQKSTIEILRKWGIKIVHRPDYWDRRNRQIVVIIDESIDEETIIFEDGISYRMSSAALDKCLDTLTDNINDRFITCVVDAINAYAKWYCVVIKREPGSQWLKKALDRIDCALNMYGIDMMSFSYLDWCWCTAHFGSEMNFRQIITDAIAFQSDEMFSKCMICKNCRCDKAGIRHCREVWVPVDENGNGIKTLRRINEDQPISNRLEDIIPTFAQRETCSLFEKNDTRLIDHVIRFRNKNLLPKDSRFEDMF